MAQKLSQPSFEPIYELDQRIDTVLGYDYLQYEATALSATFPNDEHHIALRQFAAVTLLACRQNEVQQASALRSEIRRAGLTHDANITRESEVATATRAAATKHRAAQDYESDLQGLLGSSSFAQRSPEEQATVREVLEAAATAAVRESLQARHNLAERRASVSAVKTIVKRPLGAHPDPIYTMAAAEQEPEVLDPLSNEFIRAANILHSLRHGLIHESKLIQALYPDLYVADRPAAYRYFDDMFEQFGALSQRFAVSYGYIQRGSLYQADQTGKPLRSLETSVVYRKLWNDDSEIIKNKNVVRQRLTIDGTPHSIDWQQVVPQPGGL